MLGRLFLLFGLFGALVAASLFFLLAIRRPFGERVAPAVFGAVMFLYALGCLVWLRVEGRSEP